MCWNRKLASLVVIASLGISGVAWGCGGGNLRDLLSDDPQLVQALIEELREDGQVGLTRALRFREQLEKQEVAEADAPAHQVKLQRLDDALDQIGGARYCRHSRLFWYTDFDKAREAAQATGKPILALRMMGNLTDEFSCANSRFFRTTLYANTEISQLLRENFILTWKSVRPVPKVTIDFGDGRKLERTVTGNSIHYVLTPDGQVVDALPGLYGPASFLSQVKAAGDFAKEVASLPGEERLAALVNRHQKSLTEIAAQWRADLARLRSAGDQPQARGQQAGQQQAAQPTAAKAAVVARTKRDLEMPLLVAIDRQLATLDTETTDEQWEQIANLHQGEARLDAASRNLIASQTPTAVQAGRVAITKSVVESPILKLVRNLQHSIAVDSVKNEYVLHRKLRTWLIQTPDLARNLDGLNEKVYAELFLTPSSDPWIGLAQPDVYTALQNNGVVPAAQP